MMNGPEIIARSISSLRIPDKFGNQWQYHSRSDRHSKITCWSIMFDLISHCPLLRQHIKDGKVGFGINHELRDFRTQRKKNLDLVICTPRPGEAPKPKRGNITKKPIATFEDLSAECEVELLKAERTQLAALPPLLLVPVGSVCVALEAKAVMTEHIKALPRLHDELDSSHLTVHGHADHSIAAALVTINFSSEFSSSDRNKQSIAKHGRVVLEHAQPKGTLRAIEKVREIRRRSVQSEQGFDAMGIVLVDFKNDGAPMKVVTGAPAPQPADDFHYDRLIERICSQYRAKFQGL
jgi:hypothetical protein